MSTFIYNKQMKHKGKKLTVIYAVILIFTQTSKLEWIPLLIIQPSQQNKLYQQ